MLNKKVIFLIFFLTLLLTACGIPNRNSTPDPSQTELNRSAYNWKTEDWHYSDDLYAGEIFYVEKFISGLEYQPDHIYDGSSHKYGIWGSNFYALDRFYTLTGSTQQWIYYLSCYEDATGEFWHQRVELPYLKEYEDTEIFIASFDIRDLQEYVLFAQVTKESKTLAYLAMHFTFEGEFLGYVDLYPVMQINGIILEGNSAFSGVRIDYRGYYFFSTFSGEKIVVLDVEGELITELVWNKKDAHCAYAMKTAEGELVFEEYSIEEDIMRLVMFDPVMGEEQIFTEQLPLRSPKRITKDGILYFGDNGQLYRWDLYSGDRGICFNYGQLGIGKNEFATCIGLSADNLPLIMDLSREKAIIYKLGYEPGTEEAPIRLVSLVGDSSFIASSAALFSQEHMEHPILVQQPEEDLTSFRTRALADLIAGKGADIYYVSGADMRVLYEKGILTDLSDVLEEDLRNSLYGGALACGIIDGQQIGLPLEAYVTTLLVSDELWSENSWTLEEAVKVMDEHPEFTKMMTGSRYMAKIDALRLLLLQDLSNSPFLDMDAGICDFENPLFIKVLEIIKETTGGKGNATVVNNGKAATFYVNMESFWEFSADMSDLGEGFHPVGFPTESGNGSYWNADYFLVVNAQSEHRELIDAYLATLFGQQRQMELSHPIRNDFPEANIYYSEESSEYTWQYHIGSNIYYGLHTNPDGSPWTEEYKDILNRAIPRSQNTYYIEDIILEEAASYLSGIKTAEQVAEIIQNRVQLYLNEQQ